MTCPGDLELARALTVGAGPELTAHLDACEACRTAWESGRTAIDLVRDLPAAVPPASRREEVRTAVLAAAALVRRPRRRAWIAPAIAGAAAAGVAGYVALRTSAPASQIHSHGTVRPHAGARYVASAVGPDEVVQLSEGVLDVDVEPLHPGERFRVVVGTTELEVHGTAFTVTAGAGHLVAVAVAHGRVDLRAGAGTAATLGTGQSWHSDVGPDSGQSARTAAAPGTVDTGPSHGAAAASSAEPSPVLPSPPPAPPVSSQRPARAVVSPPRRASATPDVVSRAPQPERPAAVPATPAPPPATPAARSADEISYDDAWTALRTGELSRAASGFARVMLLAPDGPLVEDASFWYAVALARGKRSAEATSAFRDFLDGHPRSARTGEASAMLAWLLIDARAYDEAARRFTAAAGDADPAIRRSAQAGLDALAHRKR